MCRVRAAVVITAMLDAIAEWSLSAEDDDRVRYHRPHPRARALLATSNVILAPRGGGKTALALHAERVADVDAPATRVAIDAEIAAAFTSLADPVERAAVGEVFVLFGAFQALAAQGGLTGGDIRAIAPRFAARYPHRIAAAFTRLFDHGLVFEALERAPAAFAGRPVADALPEARAALQPYLSARTPIVMIDEPATQPGAVDDLDALRGAALRVISDAARAATTDGVRVVILARPEVWARASGAAQDGVVTLDWSETDLMDVAAFRAARAASPDFAMSEVNAPSVLRRVFAGAARRMTASDWRRDGPWPYVWRRTRARPGDMVHFLRAAARAALRVGRDAVDPSALEAAEAAHAVFLRRAVAAELRGDIPEIDDVLAGIAMMPERGSSVADFVGAIETALSRLEATEATAGARRVMDRLFAASAIGQAAAPANGRGGQGPREVYRAADPNATLTLADRIVIHPALAHALGLSG